jgi:transposase
MHLSVALGLSRRSVDDRYYYLSFDEKSVKNGHEYITVLSDAETGVVIDVIEGRSDDSVDELCQTSLTETQRDCVRSVCTDMWQPYIKRCSDLFSTRTSLLRSFPYCWLFAKSGGSMPSS